MDDVETSSSFESMALLDSDDKPDSSEKSVVKDDGPGGSLEGLLQCSSGRIYSPQKLVELGVSMLLLSRCCSQFPEGLPLRRRPYIHQSLADDRYSYRVA
jgi:hypothetical protein